MVHASTSRDDVEASKAAVTTVESLRFFIAKQGWERNWRFKVNFGPLLATAADQEIQYNSVVLDIRLDLLAIFVQIFGSST